MKVLAIVALASVGAVGASEVKLRIHHHADAAAKVGEWGQCKEGGKPAVACDQGFKCVIQSEWYGQCLRDGGEADLWQQCNGMNWSQAAKCKQGQCVWVNDWYSQCKPNGKHHKKSHEHKKSDKVGEWGQCKEGGKPAVACDQGFKCVIQSEWYGQCLRDGGEADLWQQCNGKNWGQAAKCKQGQCVWVNDWYSQCKPNGKHHKKSHNHHAQKIAEWGQCKWEGTQAGGCDAGLKCVVQSEWYGQCLRDGGEADLWQQCNGKNWSHAAKCKQGQCVWVNDWYSQCKP